MTEEYDPAADDDFGPAGDGRRARDWRDDALAALNAEPPDRTAALTALPEPDPLAEAREALGSGEPDPQTVRRLIERLPRRPVEDALPVACWREAQIPDPVLSKAEGSSRAALLSVGEVALLASAGGLGKSTLTVGLAAVAADGGDAFGLRVEPGPVVLGSYEDAPARIAARLRWYAECPAGKDAPAAWSNLYLLPRPRSLWQADDDGGSEPGPDWSRFWRTVHKTGAKLAIVDPASVALADANTNQTGPVRAFLDAMSAEAEAHGCGVLIVAHDTKAARNEARAGGNPGAGAVAGSAAWYDAARGVLYVRREFGGLTLECLKSNYGPTGWGAHLEMREATATSGFRGPDPKPQRVFDRDALAQWRQQNREKAKKAKKRNGKPKSGGDDDGIVLD